MLCKTPPVAEFADICRTIRHAVKLFSSLFFFSFLHWATECCNTVLFKNSALQRMRCAPRCVRHSKKNSLLACSAVSSHSVSFLVIMNKHVGFWTSKWGHKYLSRGVVGLSAASSSAISARQLPRHTLPALMLHCSVPLSVIRQRISTRFLLFYNGQCCSV